MPSRSLPQSAIIFLHNYLKKHGVPSITINEALELEKPFFYSELLNARKQMKPGKSLGPDGFLVLLYIAK